MITGWLWQSCSGHHILVAFAIFHTWTNFNFWHLFNRKLNLRSLSKRENEKISAWDLEVHLSFLHLSEVGDSTRRCACEIIEQFCFRWKKVNAHCASEFRCLRLPALFNRFDLSVYGPYEQFQTVISSNRMHTSHTENSLKTWKF